MVDLPVIASFLIAIVGSIGGFAALMKVNADNSKTVSEGATNVVKMMREQVADLDARLTSVEEFSLKQEEWSDKVMTLLSRAISSMEEPPRQSFRSEADAIAAARPKRRPHPDLNAHTVTHE